MLNGKHDAFGFVQKDFSLKSLKGNCLDFEEEETLLQSMGREMGVLAVRTPKCHCELAGEGIEYSWGCAKNFYHRVSLKRKKGKEDFRSVVRESFKIWKDLDEQHDRMDAEVDTTTHEADPISVEKLVKQFKTHRCALDFDTTFCKATYIYNLT